MANKFPKDDKYRGVIHKRGNFSFSRVTYYKNWATSHPMKKGKTIEDIVKAVWCGHRISHRYAPHCTFHISRTLGGYVWEIEFGVGH